MDGKGNAVNPVPPVAVAASSGSVEAGKPALPPRSAGKGDGTRPPGNAEIRKAVREALNISPLPNRELRIEFESDLQRIVVKVMDKESGEVIRQIPTAEEIANMKHIKEQLGKMVRDQRGFAVDEEV